MEEVRFACLDLLNFLDQSRSSWFLVTSRRLGAFQAGGKAGAMEWNGDESAGGRAGGRAG